MTVADSSALVLAVADTTERGERVRSRLTEGANAEHLVLDPRRACAAL